MKRRRFLATGTVVLLSAWLLPSSRNSVVSAEPDSSGERKLEKIVMSKEQWREKLTPEQFYILREEGTERPFSSPLNDEKRAGSYHCAGCDQALFTSEMKFDSGTGWPSFFASIDDAFETKTDFKLIYPRTEYHCSHCGGHHGHVFKDGPPPTGKRWCNNGIALKFIPA